MPNIINDPLEVKMVTRKTLGVDMPRGSTGGGGGGTSDYDDLTDKPQINDVTLSGNKSTSDLGLDQTLSAVYGTTTNAEIEAALMDNKICACTYNGHIYYLTSASWAAQLHIAYFSADISGDTSAWVKCQNGTWSNGTTPIPTKVSVVEVSTAGAVTQAIDVGKIYDFTGALTSLTITLNSATAPTQYHIRFNSGSTAVSLTLPQTVTMPSGFTVEANKHYEIDILDGYGVAQSW